MYVIIIYNIVWILFEYDCSCHFNAILVLYYPFLTFEYESMIIIEEFV